MRMQEETYYIQKLKEEFSKRQRRNPSFSLRAYARFLGVNIGTLSGIFSHRRHLPIKRASQVIKKIGLSPEETRRFLSSILDQKISLKNLADVDAVSVDTILDESIHFDVIACWEYYAFLSLLCTHDYRQDFDWIASRLGISKARVEVVTSHLVRLNLIVFDPVTEKFKQTSRKLGTSQDVVSSALRKAHQEALEMAAERLNSVPVELRDYSIETLAIDAKKIPEAKKLIREFRQKFSALLESKNQHEVYQLCIQMYPLTTVREAKKEKKDEKNH